MPKWFVTFKESWRNARYLRKQKQRQLSSRPAMAADELAEAYERLKSVTQDDEELLKHLDKLKSTADDGPRMSWWTRRLTTYQDRQRIKEAMMSFILVFPRKFNG